jgi:predicted Na+-dependent transporter
MKTLLVARQNENICKTPPLHRHPSVDIYTAQVPVVVGSTVVFVVVAPLLRGRQTWRQRERGYTMVDWKDIVGNVLLFFLVFGMSATVEMSSLRTQLKNCKALMTGMFLQFAVLPVLGFMMVKLLKLNDTVGIMLLVVTSSPGGSFSNW